MWIAFPPCSDVKEILHTLYMRSRLCHTENDPVAFPRGQGMLAFIIVFCPHSTPLCEACDQGTSMSVLPMAVSTLAVRCQCFCLGFRGGLEKPRDWKAGSWAARDRWWGENWDFASLTKAASQKWVAWSCILFLCFTSVPGCDQLLCHRAAPYEYMGSSWVSLLCSCAVGPPGPSAARERVAQQRGASSRAVTMQSSELELRM